MKVHPAISPERLNRDLADFARIGRKEDGSICRLALTEEDRLGRDRIVSLMKDLDMDVRVDGIGNIFGFRKGKNPELSPVMMGSHIDSVATGGPLDGTYGVLGALEVLRTLREVELYTERPLAMGIFTNEEGVRYTPDMLGSLVHAGGLPLEEALAIRGIDGSLLGEELRRIGYAGDYPCGSLRPFAFLELHVEQGPCLDREGLSLGAVTGVNGISWQEVTLEGEPNHAGTTPMDMRADAGLGAARLIREIRSIAESVPHQRGTCGALNFFPNLINVVPQRAVFTVDLRNGDNELLRQAEEIFRKAAEDVAREEGLRLSRRQLVRFDPVVFDENLVRRIENAAASRGLSCRRISSGAGHDAQMMARICPTAMIFVPSKGGISHNPREETEPEHLALGVQVLLDTVLSLAEEV
ncbi:MAG TPA: Zn-dependent hydrolase [Synergistaceae bacterium]|nr:Zn-dependent hydrolase [Synergistaceae bacterium]